MQASEPGTIRGDYCIEVGRNVIHGSDSVENAQKEIALWFGGECAGMGVGGWEAGSRLRRQGAVRKAQFAAASRTALRS